MINDLTKRRHMIASKFHDTLFVELNSLFRRRMDSVEDLLQLRIIIDVTIGSLLRVYQHTIDTHFEKTSLGFSRLRSLNNSFKDVLVAMFDLQFPAFSGIRVPSPSSGFETNNCIMIIYFINNINLAPIPSGSTERRR